MIEIPAFKDADNETFVRESLVWPLLRAVGYAAEEILPEVQLKFRIQDKIHDFRADYVVSTEHKFDLPPNKLVVEVKRPSESLLEPKALEQARVYASHPSVQATCIVLVNGIHLAVYAPSGPLLNLVRRFEVARLNSSWGDLVSLIGPESLSSQFAGMQIVGQIGSGGYGRVFKARNLQLNRLEALKVLHPGAEETDTIRRRFDRGARGQAALEHPYICQIHELGLFRGRPYYRMELVPGVSITQFVVERNLPFPDRLALFRKICEALTHAHSNGVVHCDLKPANVLVKGDGDPKLIDFDFCHLGSGASTILSQVVATIAYMDPTIWQDAGNRDALADVYSVGLLLWSALTGQDLMPGWTPHFLIAELSRMGAEAEHLGPLILRCIQGNRADRPKDIEEVVKLIGIKEWRTPVQSLLDGTVSNFAVHSPGREFEYRYRLWQQTGDLPGSVDFDRLTKGIPQRPLSQHEREFIFRAASSSWSKKYRSIFKEWSADALIDAARIVLDDHRIDEAYRYKVGETHPARQAIDILAVTDEYRSREDSERVVRFLFSRLRSERLPAVFFTTLDDLSRFQCFKPKNSRLRTEASRILIEMVEERLPKATKSSAKQIGKLLEKLDPVKCGEDSAEVAKFVGRVARHPALLDQAIMLLGCLENPAATDEFIDLLEAVRGTSEFERVAMVAIGVKGRHPRRAVAEYLEELPDYEPSETLRQSIQPLLEK